MTTENDKTTTALAVHQSALPMRGLADLVAAGELLSQSKMFGAINPAAGFIVVATCQQQGISLMEFNRTYHIIDGKPSMRADAMLAEFRKRGGKVKIIENSVTRAAGEFAFDGNKQTFEFTLDDAKRTGDCLKGDGKTMKEIWQKRSDDMLWARMVSRAVRRLCPEINAGLYAPEEVQDFDDRPQRTDAALVPLTAQDAAARARPVAVTVEVVKTAPAVNCGLCPVGGPEFEGKPWTEFESEMLNALLESDEAEITIDHKAAIRRELESRKGGAA